MIYKIYCKLNEQFVSHKINNGPQYRYFYGKFTSQLDRCNLITTTTGKVYINKKAAERLCKQLNLIVVDGFEVKEYSLEEK